MKGLIIFLLTGILSFVAGLYYPWWSLAVVAFAIALIFGQRPVAAFFTAFLAVFVFWFGYSYFIDLSNDHILAGRMSQLFIQTELPVVMCVISGVAGGLVAGFAALCGSFLRGRKKQKKVYTPSYV